MLAPHSPSFYCAMGSYRHPWQFPMSWVINPWPLCPKDKHCQIGFHPRFIVGPYMVLYVVKIHSSHYLHTQLKAQWLSTKGYLTMLRSIWGCHNWEVAAGIYSLETGVSGCGGAPIVLILEWKQGKWTSGDISDYIVSSTLAWATQDCLTPPSTEARDFLSPQIATTTIPVMDITTKNYPVLSIVQRLKSTGVKHYQYLCTQQLLLLSIIY